MRPSATEEDGGDGGEAGPPRRGPEHRADHQRPAGGRFARGHLRPSGGAEHCGRHPPLGWQDLHRQELTASGSLPAPGGFGGGGRTPARAQRAGLRRHRLRRDDAAECAGVASAAGGRDISIKDTRELRQHRASCLRLEALGLDPRRDDGRRASLDGGPPRGGGWHRGCRSPVHRPDGGIRDHGARENRWVVEPVWPSPALGTKAAGGEVAAGTQPEAVAVTRPSVGRPRAETGGVPSGGVVLTTLADHQDLDVLACCRGVRAVRRAGAGRVGRAIRVGRAARRVAPAVAVPEVRRAHGPRAHQGQSADARRMTDGGNGNSTVVQG